MSSEPRSGSPVPTALRILHLEDSPADCALVQDTLDAADLTGTFTHVDNERAFIHAIAHDRFDVILADYTLPGYDGAAALAAAREFQPDTPFIFISATIGEDRAIEILKEGATDYVLKNRIARLVPAIRRALREAQERNERRLAEKALRDSEQRFREMAENISEVFWSASADGRCIHYISPAYELVWNRSLTALVARPETWPESILPEDREHVLQARARLAEGRPCTLEYRISLPGGGHRWIEEHSYPVIDDHGRVHRSVGVALDLTARKNLEEQLHQAQKMDAIGQLAGGIAHDFSNMLTVINGSSSLLLERPGLPADVAAALRQIYVAGGRAADLTRQLLLFSRKSEPTRGPLDLNEVVDEAAVMLRRMIGETIRLELDLARPLPRATADVAMIDQVLMNLAVNARDAMPRGGDLVIGTGSCEFTEADCARNPQARPGAFVWLGVRDTGCGIAPELLPRIFEPFFTTKAVGKGTGLGLATVFGIARQHHGWVEVESEVGAGTLFRVFLPVATAAGPADAPSTAIPPPVRGGKETILLVEDEAMVREYACTVLQRQGYKVLQAATGVDALEAWKWHRNKISLLLTDVVLPDDMTGPQLATRLHADRPDLPVLFSSGYSEEAPAPALGTSATGRFLHKPYQPDALARLVRESLDQGLPAPPRT